MKAELKFNLDEHEDRMAHYRCVKALDMACVLFQIGNLRKKCLSNIQEDNSETAINKVFDDISDLMQDYNIDLNEILE